MASLRHLCRSLQRSAKMPKMCGFASRNGCKDGIVHTGGISTIYLQCGRVHLCNILGPFLLGRPSLCRLCGVFAVVFADLCCKDHAEHPQKIWKYPSFFMISRYVFKTFFSSYVEKNVVTLKIQWKHVGIPCFPSRKRGVACVVAIYGCTCLYVNIKSLKKCGLWIWPNFGF